MPKPPESRSDEPLHFRNRSRSVSHVTGDVPHDEQDAAYVTVKKTKVK
jgi:hypothetical protein